MNGAAAHNEPRGVFAAGLFLAARPPARRRATLLPFGPFLERRDACGHPVRRRQHAEAGLVENK